MKIRKKTVVTFCIIIPILAIVLYVFFLFTQKPDFSKYHSYEVITLHDDIPLTDEQFQRIVNVYENDETLHFVTSAPSAGYLIKLYETDDMSGEYDIMSTGGDRGDGSLYLIIDRGKNNNPQYKLWEYKNPDTMKHVKAIIKEAEEAIDQSESEQEL